MGMKAIVSMLEMISVVIILFVVFNVFFPGFSYRSKWSDALLILKARDLTLTLDRVGKLYEFSFDPKELKNFLDKAIYPENASLIYWSETEGTIKNKIFIACNCTSEQLANLSYWFSGLKINGRKVEIVTCLTYLKPINRRCDPERERYPDILLVWGNKNLDEYKQELIDYLKGENGLVEIADIKQSDITPGGVQETIFNLNWCDPSITGNCGWGPVNTNSFLKPESANKISYMSYKFFHHVPLPLKAPKIEVEVPVEGISQPTCADIRKGNFTFNSSIYSFWICDGTSVYFDSDANGTADKVVLKRESFNLSKQNYNFTLNYVEPSGIAVSFKLNYKFKDFLEEGGSKLYPKDGDVSKILLSKGNWSDNKPIPVVILNQAYGGRTAWIADFSRGEVEDDHKNLLLSILLWASNKKAEPALGKVKIGYATSYLNVKNLDMFEVYRFNLGLGYPF